MTPTIQKTKFPPETKVQFGSWVENRPKELSETLGKEYDPGIGEIVRTEFLNGQTVYLVQWQDLSRGLYYEQELKENAPEIKNVGTIEYYDEKADKLKWLKIKAYRRVKSKKTGKVKGYRDRHGVLHSLEEIRKEYDFHLISEIIYKRLAVLAGLDGDFASTENGVGFNKFDTEFGHALTEKYQQYGSWTVKQLRAAIRLQHKYKAQLKRVLGDYYRSLENWKSAAEILEMEDKYLD